VTSADTPPPSGAPATAVWTRIGGEDLRRGRIHMDLTQVELAANDLDRIAFPKRRGTRSA
jgi:hypothetical protein